MSPDKIKDQVEGSGPAVSGLPEQEIVDCPACKGVGSFPVDPESALGKEGITSSMCGWCYGDKRMSRLQLRYSGMLEAAALGQRAWPDKKDAIIEALRAEVTRLREMLSVERFKNVLS